jgi:flagella basal body P-ring formation protein FlgA
MMIAALILSTGGVSVTLPAETDVRGLELTLGVVATVAGSEQDAVTRVRALTLGRAPAPGYSRVLRIEDVAALLQATFPELPIDVQGEQRCRVRPRTERIEAARLQEVALAALAEHFVGQEVETRLQAELADLLVPMGRNGVRLDASAGERGGGPGRWSIPVRVTVDDELYQTVWTSWSVEVWQEREVLARGVLRGEPLAPADFERRRVRVQEARSGLRPSSLRGAVARRDLPAGSIVTERDVERPRVVRRGDTLHLEVKKGQVTARAVAVAQQDGRLGDRIRVAATATGREFLATVVSRELVELRMP